MDFEAWSAPNEVTRRMARTYSGFQALRDRTGTLPDTVQCTALFAQLGGRREVSTAAGSYRLRENSPDPRCSECGGRNKLGKSPEYQAAAALVSKMRISPRFRFLSFLNI